MRAVAVIPARMGSSRFPGKPLAKLLGLSMIEHVYRRTALCEDLDDVIVATCDAEIREVAEAFGAPVAMTGSHHERASERMAEVAEDVEADVFILVQGDEPMIRPEMVSAALAPLEDPSVDCVNLMRRIEDPAGYRDENTIKVVVDQQDDALFMSRQPIPTIGERDWGTVPAYKQVCVIPFRRRALLEYARLPATPLEQAESIDMLRLLEHGRHVRMVETPFDTQAVDTESDRVRVERLLVEDALLKVYA